MRSAISVLFVLAVASLIPTAGSTARADDFFEFWYSTEISFRSGDPTGIAVISHGDLLSHNSCVVKTHAQLIANLGFMPAVREKGLDAVTQPLVSVDPPEVYFSLEQGGWSENLGWIGHGDLLSDRGAIVRTNQRLIARFEPEPTGTADVGLDAVQAELISSHVPTGFLFSVEEDFFSVALNRWISHGDLLAETGFIFRTYEDLLANFTPLDENGMPMEDHDFGLDAVFVKTDGTIWFSVEKGFVDASLGWVDDGDLLSDLGTIVIRNADLVAACNPLEDRPLGLDSIHFKCPSCVIDPDRELLIRHPSVVDDPSRTTCTSPDPADCGPWTFAALMAAVAGTDDREELSDFVLHWLGDPGTHWLDPELEINGFDVPARTAMDTQVIEPWKALTPGEPLDFSQAPFRLLAIVNRPDLRNGEEDLDLIKAGEGRFVFGVLPGGQFTSDFTIIFEFKLPGETCEDVQDWQLQWHALGSLELETEAFNVALQEITDQFATIGADPTAPNGTALSQLRTNEILLDAPWELREFRVLCPGDPDCPSGGEQVCPGVTGRLLTETTVEQEPDFLDLNGTPLLSDYLNDFAEDILAGHYRVPCQYHQENFRAGSAPVFGAWTAPGVPLEVRDAFALNTCSGCHRFETGTVFQHIQERLFLEESTISLFLEEDLELRAEDMCDILKNPCESAGDGEGTAEAAAMSQRPEFSRGRAH